MTARTAVLLAAGVIDFAAFARVPDPAVQGRAAGELMRRAFVLADAGVDPSDLRRLMVAGGCTFKRRGRP